MATWMDQLQPAAYKDVGFHVDTIDVTAGENLVVREYPFQDLPTVFSMGKAAEEIRFSAYVIGDDYIDQRESLRDALMGDGGVLIHPTAGRIRVRVASKFRITENPTAEGGIARFELHFVRAEARRYPVAVDSLGTLASNAANKAKDAAVDDFSNRFNLLGQPGWVNDKILSHLDAVLGTTWDSISAASQGLSDFQSGIIGAYQQLRSGLDDLVSTPRALADQIGLLFALPADLKSVGTAGFQDAFKGLFDVGSKVIDTSFQQRIVPATPDADHPVIFGQGDPAALTLPSSARTNLLTLRGAVNNLINTLAVASYVDVLAQTDLTSYDSTLAMRKAIYDQCTGLLTAASSSSAPASLPSSNWHDAMLALLSAALADLQTRSVNATRLMTWTPQRWMPIWVVSYELYGTTQYADEVMQLNPHITHPLLVPPGRALKVLRHA